MLSFITKKLLVSTKLSKNENILKKKKVLDKLINDLVRDDKLKLYKYTIWEDLIDQMEEIEQELKNNENGDLDEDVEEDLKDLDDLY